MTHHTLSAFLFLPIVALLAGCPEPPPDAPGGAAGSPTCPTGEKLCGGACVPEDIAHGCAADSCEPCYVAEGTAACSADGACTLAACNAGWSQCHGDIGCQTHTDADVNNCGACGNACSFPHAAAQCFNGKCWMGACEPGYGSCYDVPPTNGCETYLDGDPKNCGACGNVCAPSQMCVGGSCVACTGCINSMGACVSGEDKAECGSGGGSCSTCSADTACAVHSCAGACQTQWVNEGLPCPGGTCHSGQCVGAAH